MTERLCRYCRGWHNLDAWPGNCLPEAPQRSEVVPVPHFIRDTMDPIQSQVTGQMYDSKAALRREYKAHGVTEIGNDKMPPRQKPKPDRKAIRQSVEKAVARYDRGERIAQK